MNWCNMINWSIFKDSSSKDPNKWIPNYIAWYYNYNDKDEDVIRPDRVEFLLDGPVEITFEWNGKSSSVVTEIINGHFDNSVICNQLEKIIKHTGYWGTFIEGFYKKNDKLRVMVGS